MEELIALREQARAKKDYATSDRLRLELLRQGVRVEDIKDGTTKWYYMEPSSSTSTAAARASRGTFKRSRKAKKRRKNVQKKQRFRLFTEWFLSTFPNPHHVWDIALTL